MSETPTPKIALPSAPAQWVLQAHAAGRQPQFFDLNSTPLIIGRAVESDILLDSVRVSRRHAELSHDSVGYWSIRDLGSRNGTKVNGTLILEPTLVRPHDHIHIGEFELRLQLGHDPHLVESVNPQTTLWVDDESHEFTMLGTAPAPRLAARHLAMVQSLGHRLFEINDAHERLVALCRWMVDSEIRGTMAVVLRIQRGAKDEPAILCSIHPDTPHGASGGVLRAVVDAAIEEEHPILAGGAAASGLTGSFPSDSRGVSAAIACKLASDSNSVDVLYVTVPREFGTVDWLALVALAAEQFKKTALQLDARRITDESSALQHDLKKARQIQMSLIPTAPSVPGLEIAIGFDPCQWIGGDYVNVMQTPDNQILLAIADVSGKGLSAALVASGVHSIVHAAIRSGRDLNDLAQSLNQYLLESMDRQSFVTMAATIFNPQTGNMRIINAGHPPMLIVDPTGDSRETRYGHNPPLGVVPMTIEIDTLTLQPGQLLVLFTDGLSELHEGKGKMIGVPGLQRELGQLYKKHAIDPLTDLAQLLKSRLTEIHGSAPAEDDRTFLLARRAPE